jgi:DNA repair exonuclease SbcCD ATPase subunit
MRFRFGTKPSSSKTFLTADNFPMKNTTTELEIVSQEDAKLIEYAGKTGLEVSSTTPLVEAFRPIFTEARSVLSQAVGVAESVKDATCVSEIKKARACRLAIRKVRISGEAIRKSQKATALAYGKAVDGFYNILEADLAPVEKALLDAEETAERAETARKDALEEGRKTALSPYVDDASLYAVRDMSEPAFVALLAGVKLAKEQSEAAAKKAEADRIAKEQAEAAERARVKAENERLKKEALEQAKAQEEERAKAAQAAEKARLEREAIELAASKERQALEEKARIEAERQRKLAAEAEAKAKAEREAIELKAKAERDAALAKAAQEKKAADEALAKAAQEKKAADEALAKAAQEKKAADEAIRKEREAREKLEAEAAAKAKVEFDAHEAAEAARKKAARAPDREKVKAFAASVRSLAIPVVKSPEALAVVATIQQQIEKFAKWADDKAESL